MNPLKLSHDTNMRDILVKCQNVYWKQKNRVFFLDFISCGKFPVSDKTLIFYINKYIYLHTYLYMYYLYINVYICMYVYNIIVYHSFLANGQSDKKKKISSDI